jgi:hypothetical protein
VCLDAAYIKQKKNDLLDRSLIVSSVRMISLVLVENTVMYGRQKFLIETVISCGPYTLISLTVTEWYV